MRNMKDSGIEWIGKIPENWQVVRVKNIFYRKNEKAKLENPTVLSLARSGVKVRDISNNEGQLAESYYNYNPVSKGDLLLNPMDLYSGANCSISNVEGVISPAYINLRAKDNVCAKYYDYYFKTQYWSMALFAHGKGVSFDNRWTLNLETLMNYNLPFTSLEVQELIAYYLDNKVKEIDNIISKTQETIEEYKKYKQSVITEAVTKGLNPNVEMKDSGIEWIGEIPKHWQVMKMNSICTTITDYVASGSFASLNENVKYLDEPDYAMLVRTTDVSGKNNSEKVYINRKAYEFLHNSNLFGGEIILPNIGASVGDVYKVPKLYPRMSLAPNSIMIKTKFLDDYYYYMFLSSLGKVILLNLCQSTAQPKFNKTELRNIRLLVPTIKEQKNIVKYLDLKCSKIDKLITKKQNLITQLESYKKSLIYEYVTGKKEVTVAYGY